jgi:hypothetical protein
MPRVKLTKSVIDGLATPPSDTLFWDVSLPGFGVKVTPKGRKVFIVLYRTGGLAQSCASTRSVHMDGSPSTRLV